MSDDNKKTVMGVSGSAKTPVPTASRATSPLRAEPEIAATLPPTMAPPIAEPVAATLPPTMAPPTNQPVAATIPPTMAPSTGAGTIPMGKRGVPMPGDGSDDFIGQEMCGYVIKRKLAEGGMGVVFEGEHAKIGRRGAIKVLKPEFCRSTEVVERFYQEARAVNSIRHENIVEVYDFGRDEHGRVFFVMEYLEGEPLSAKIKRGALKWSEAFPILEQTLRALKAAHDKGFVHRDLKPDNIWLKQVESGVEVKLLDFGIAKLVGTESPKEKLTQTGSVIGTPHYMSPEQINGSKDIDHRTDIYAMGVITYEMFAGVTPFVGDTMQAVMTGHLFKDAPRLADIPIDLGVPPPLAEIIDRMLVKDAAERYESVADVLADLRDVNKHRQPAKAETLNRTRPTRDAQPLERPEAAPGASWKLPVMIIGALAVLAVAGLGIWKITQKPAATPVAAAPKAVVPAPGEPAKPAVEVEKQIDHDAVRKDAQLTLRAALQQSEPMVRVQGSDALGKIKDEASVPALSTLTETDPDAEVRGHTADALGMIGAANQADLLAKLEKAAPAPLKVWYASALARLGDKGARKRLLGYARDKDLAVSFKAGLTLADISQPGDKEAIAALKGLAVHEAELNNLAPYAGAVILTKMAALRDANARKVLYSILESKDEGSRLAAAEGLARLGDDGGKQVLQDVFANETSPNRLVASIALIPLGDYAGFELIGAKLDDKDPETRRLAARALGDIGERKSLAALIALAQDKDWTVRISAAAAIVAIVGLDPQVLAQASVDWTKSALGSQDWAVRKAAAGVLGDMPEKDAVPLLAQAIADPDANVRLAASKSAGRMKSPEAAAKVAIAVKAETDPKVKEQQVKALGEIGSATVRDTLAEIAEEPGRIGVVAAGSLIAVGDPSGKAKLDIAVVAPQVEMRLAAVQAAATAKNPIVVTTLKTGVADKIFDVRFSAAEGLAIFRAEKAAAVPVLQAGLESKDVDIQGRAQTALVQLGEKISDKSPTPAEMIESTDPRVRLAAVPIVRALPPSEGVPLLRRLVVDSNQDVRRAGVDAIEEVATKDKDQAIKLYKPLITDADPVVRSKASGQLSRLVEPPPAKVAAATAPPTPAPDPTPAVDDTLPKVQAASAEATAAASDARTAKGEFDAAVTEIATTTAIPARDDAALKRLELLATNLEEAVTRLEAAATRTEAAAKAAADAAGVTPSADAAKLVAEAASSAQEAREAATAARGKTASAAKKVREYVKAETGDAQMYVAAADAAIAVGNFTDAKQNLDKATKLNRAAGTKNAALDYSYAQLYDKMASRTRDPAAKLKLMQQAQDAYARFAKTGSGSRVQRANDRAAELGDEIKELGTP
ncbi:MAG: HEAT repeat domain-containing protein [Deltaproteobacteria bacterium]|nr:HEAT repeat domain-containing protein [Deltaproteobacteria bacterium]